MTYVGECKLRLHSTLITLKLQLVDSFTGNVAWAHVCAKQSLKRDPSKIGGFPVFITDDTPIEDTSRFCQRLSRQTKVFNLRPTSLYIPSLLAYLFAFILELFVYVLNWMFGFKLSFQPRALVSYAGSMLMYSRLRAELHLDYEPLYDESTSFAKSIVWYEKWYQSYFNGVKTKQN